MGSKQELFFNPFGPSAEQGDTATDDGRSTESLREYERPVETRSACMVATGGKEERP
jgi:hypothetical protein